MKQIRQYKSDLYPSGVIESELYEYKGGKFELSRYFIPEEINTMDISISYKLDGLDIYYTIHVNEGRVAHHSKSIVNKPSNTHVLGKPVEIHTFGTLEHNEIGEITDVLEQLSSDLSDRILKMLKDEAQEPDDSSYRLSGVFEKVLKSPIK